MKGAGVRSFFGFLWLETILVLGVGYVGYRTGRHESRVICRRVLQRNLVLSKKEAERRMDVEERFWNLP